MARKHVIEVTPTGLISLLGGKWTVYRKMGEECVDECLDYLSKNKLIDKIELADKN